MNAYFFSFFFQRFMKSRTYQFKRFQEDRSPRNLLFLCFLGVFASSLYAADPAPESKPPAPAPAAAAVSDAPSTEEQQGGFDNEESSEAIVLKMMIVNPSDKYKQTFPMKAYLPAEVQPEHIIDKGDLELGYDPEKKAYYVKQDVELDPGASVVKQIRLEDVWMIPEDKLNSLAQDARQLFGKLRKTEYEERGRLLLSNVEVLLTQVFERQNDKTVTPAEHISFYRENQQKIRDIELDIVALRRLLEKASGDTGLSGKGSQNAGVGFFGSAPEDQKELLKSDGGIPAWVAWRIIFGILGFLGFVTLGFYLTWQYQLRMARNKMRKAPKKTGPDEGSLENLLSDEGKLSFTQDFPKPPQ